MLRSVAQEVIQISFNAAFDPLHAVFRLARIRDAIRPIVRIEIEKLRIIDFYFVFPFLIGGVRLKREHAGIKRRVSNETTSKRPYGPLPDEHVLFERMAPMQFAAIEILMEKAVVLPEKLATGSVQFTDTDLPVLLEQRVKEINAVEQSVVELAQALGAEYELRGPDGLKSRTGLIEYRYDAV